MERKFIFPEQEDDRCIEPNCYTKKIEYGPSTDQIMVLILRYKIEI